MNGSDAITEAEVGLFDRSGTTLRIDFAEAVTALLLCGEPIDEPIVGQGPFVMNTRQEIVQAIVDYQSGKMGALSPVSSNSSV
ncbi:pirin-like C-terminal cupin domain-containing protein [Leptolyngbya sp. 7M]|uniref:pirin-like C-terminal cupin domain-containing protein n=1 Tax=Leptolyngbya sp. 7M TaxID=2812896 RepID=UPI0021F22574|nr:pirin-like C-terminal cupin domain-containing protein [Leptolyngbya sp. 7M]